MKTLLHTCCAPCSIKCIETLREEDIEPVLFWYNPNIHPFMEYRGRKNALVEYARSADAQLILEGEYGLRGFVAELRPPYNDRCGYCYRTRLAHTARFAAEQGYESFSTTLLISPYQDHDMICEIADNAAKKHGVAFLHRDFRPRFRDGQQAARYMGLYMQKYCGCVFSEEERYRRKKKP